jgi:molybdopterin synthase sulfur carrier subunit
MRDATTITIHVPRELRDGCDGAREVVVSAAQVQSALEELERCYPAVYRGVCDESGQVRRHINLFVNSSHMRDRDGLSTTLAAGDTITILPAVSGG